MLRTSVGYCGGNSAHHPNPTYGSVCRDKSGHNHTEVTLVEFDPKVMSFDKLLSNYKSRYFPPSGRGGKQYRSGIWCTSPTQLAAAKEFAEKNGVSNDLQVESLEYYYLAEEYHQKYFKKGSM